MPTTTAFRGGASVRALKEGDTSITITAGSIVKTIPVSVWGNKWVLPTLPATRNGITFTAAGDGMVHAKGTATDWATILVTQDLPAGEYTLEHTLVDGVGPFCELKSTDGRIDLFSRGTVKATLPAGDYQMLVSVSPRQDRGRNHHPNSQETQLRPRYWGLHHKRRPQYGRTINNRYQTGVHKSETDRRQDYENRADYRIVA